MTDRRNQDRDLDLAPEAGAPTDVARTGRSHAAPAHETTADEDSDEVDWQSIASSPAFRSLLRAKARFIIPATVFFFLYYFALPVLVGWYPELMRRRIGPVNLAYAFALSQFFVAWAVALAYLRQAIKFDTQAAAVLSGIGTRKDAA